MNSATAMKMPLVAPDELTASIAAAQARIAEVYSTGRKTLIDAMTLDQWKAWDASNEMSIVCDSDGLAAEADLDQEICIAA